MSIFNERKNYKPFKYDEITLPLIEAMWKGHWTHLEFDFKSDKQDFYVKLSEEERASLESLQESENFKPKPDKNEKTFWEKIRETFS